MATVCSCRPTTTCSCCCKPSNQNYEISTGHKILTSVLWALTVPTSSKALVWGAHYWTQQLGWRAHSPPTSKISVAYCGNNSTRLDEIQNFHAEVQADDVRRTTLDTVKSIPFAVFPDSAPGVSGQKG